MHVQIFPQLQQISYLFGNYLDPKLNVFYWWSIIRFNWRRLKIDVCIFFTRFTKPSSLPPFKFIRFWRDCFFVSFFCFFTYQLFLDFSQAECICSFKDCSIKDVFPKVWTKVNQSEERFHRIEFFHCRSMLAKTAG